MKPKTPQNTPPPALARCPEAVQRNLKAYTDGELKAFGKWRVARHIASCESCREEVVWLKNFTQELREQKSATPRPELRARILANLPETPSPASMRPTSAVRTPLLAPRYAIGTAAILLVAAFGGAFALNQMGIGRAGITQAQAGAALPQPPHTKFTPEPNTAQRLVLPNDSEHINEKAEALFQKKMQSVASKPPIVKIPPAAFDATEATADTPNIQFTPSERAKTEAYLQQMTQAVQQMGGAVEHTSAKSHTEKREMSDSSTLLTIRIPAKQVEEMFHSVRHLGNFSKLQKPHGGGKPAPPSVTDHSSRPQMRVPFPAKGDEDRNLTLTPDNQGFVTLHLEVKPNAPEGNR